MGPEDALDDEMRRHLRNAVPPLDPDTAERMLDGAVHPEDAPPGYRDVLRVLAAATTPTASDPAAEAAARAAFRSARRAVDPPRRTSVLSRLLGAKVLAALALGTASVGTATAAATGTLPDPAQAAAHRLVGALPDADRTERTDRTDGAEAATASGSAASASAGGQAAAGHAVGLCRAYQAGAGGERGGKLDSAAYERLEKAAGGAGRIAAYCRDVPAGRAPSGSHRRATAAGADAAVAGHCRSWLAAEQQGRAATLGRPVLDRLAAAAGGTDAVAAYCSALVGRVGPAAADRRQGPTTAPRPTTAVPPAGDAGARGANPSRPAPAPRR